MAYISSRRQRAIERAARSIKNLTGPHLHDYELQDKATTLQTVRLWRETWVTCPAAQIAAAISDTEVSCPTCETHKPTDLEANYS